MTDQFYIQKVTEGDTESFRFLVDRYKDKAFSVAFSVLHDLTLAEDTVQEAFINAFRKIHTYRAEAAFSTWLMRIVVNESIKVLRRKKISMDAAKEIREVDEYDVNQSIQSIRENEQKHFIDLALGKMPPREALILELFYLEEQSLKEIESIMGLNTDNVKVILFRARKRFYSILQQELKHELKYIV